MRLFIIATILMTFMMASSPILAGQDDTAWIAKCLEDNKKEGVSTETVIIYCHCMNDKMSESEEQSITEWEKTHPQEREECSKKAGWK